MMKLSELMPVLNRVGIGPVGSWEMHGRKGITLGDPKKYFPYPTGPQTPIDCTKDNDPNLTVGKTEKADESVERQRMRDVA